MKVIKNVSGRTAIIPHGVEERFFHQPKSQFNVERYSFDAPLRVLYVSPLDVYKHQWHVAKAVSLLRARGLPISLFLIGGAYPPALKKFNRELRKMNGSEHFVHYSGPAPHGELHRSYHEADLMVFASSCENMPNILLEAMASGLPIACSNRGPNPEILGQGGVYFDPENPEEILGSLEALIKSPELRAHIAKEAYHRARTYSWSRCADETFGFLANIAQAEQPALHGRCRVANLFDNKAHCWSSKYEGPLKNRVDTFTTTLQRWVPTGLNVLDFGCGSGVFTRLLAEKGYQLTAVDASEKMIKECWANTKQLTPPPKCVLGGVEVILGKSFNSIVCLSVLEYLENAEETIARLSASLLPGGLLYISIPNKKSASRILENVTRELLPFLEFLPSRKLAGYLEYLTLSRTRYDLDNFIAYCRKLDLQCVEQVFFHNRLKAASHFRPLCSMVLLVFRKNG